MRLMPPRSSPQVHLFGVLAEDSSGLGVPFCSLPSVGRSCPIQGYNPHPVTCLHWLSELWLPCLHEGQLWRGIGCRAPSGYVEYRNSISAQRLPILGPAVLICLRVLSTVICLRFFKSFLISSSLGHFLSLEDLLVSSLEIITTHWYPLWIPAYHRAFLNCLGSQIYVLTSCNNQW